MIRLSQLFQTKKPKVKTSFLNVDEYKKHLELRRKKFWYKVDMMFYRIFIKPFAFLSPNNIIHNIKYAWFYFKEGWDLRDCWSLDVSFAEWMLKNFDSILPYIENELEIKPIKYTLKSFMTCWIYSDNSIFVSNKKSLSLLFYYVRKAKENNDPFADEFAKWWILRLEYFSNHLHGYPAGLKEEEWTKILDKMRLGLEYFGEWKLGLGITTQEKENIIDESFNLLVEYMGNLWD